MPKTIQSVEENAQDVINFLQKNSLRMILWTGERSYNWGYNFCKLTDGKSICEIQIRDKIPPLEVVELCYGAIILYEKRFKANIELKLKGRRKYD